jgi:predicted lipid-binding transport protein (Tim44 family)
MKPLSPLCRSVLVAAGILGLSALLAWSAPGYLDPEWSRRLLGALLGAVVVAYANDIPKALAARARMRCSSPAADQAARRFAGWSLVLGGLAYMLAWLLAPLDRAGLIGGLALGAAVTCAALGCIRIGARRHGAGG